jgi:hypothetical protein
MSEKCAERHCPHPRACKCYGWCAGHRAGFATWQCEHLKPPVIKVQPPELQIKTEPKPELAKTEPEQKPEPTQPEQIPSQLITILRPSYPLPDVVEDDNEPDFEESPRSVSPPKTPPPPDPVEELAKMHAEHVSQITAEMEAMRAKLKQFEEQKAIIENIQLLESQCVKLQHPEPPPQQKNEKPKLSRVIPTVTARPVLSNSNSGQRIALISAKKK